MKIAVVGLRGFPDVQGGIETHCGELYPRLAKMGCEVVAYGRRKYCAPNGMVRPLLWFGKSWMETASYMMFAWFATLRNRPDIVHIHGIGPALFAPLFRMLGCRVVLTHHGRDYERGKWGRFSKWLLRKGEKIGLRYAQEVICIDRVTFNCLNQDFQDFRIKGRIDFIPNGIEIPERKNDASGDYVFALGRFVPEKSFNTLVAAFASATLSDRNRLVIAGSGPNHPPEVEGVEYPGFVTGKRKEDLFLHCRLFVIPSLHEGLPFTLLEAMAYGCDILASDIPAHKAVGLPEDCYFVAGDENNLREKIIYKLNKRQNQDLQDSRMKDRIEHPISYDELLKKEYDWNVIAQKTLEVYQK